MNVITRFAPSPTGHLHIGGARTAIFCWLLARHFGGSFVLRIEDTDIERSKQEYTESILASMSWLGLTWEDEPAYQRERFPLYNEYIDKLLASGHAYWCDCTAEQVEEMREKARATGAKPKYDGSCRHRGLTAGEGRVVRLAAPLEGRVEYSDMIKGTIGADVSELDDMVLRRSDGSPTYNLAVVVDDLTMGITHVIRGDDHVNNTFKQILLYNAFGVKLPIFGHVPMILGADRQKLSKRHGAKAVIEYEKDGLLPEALVNYLVRLGWSHKDQEIFSQNELIEFFDGTNLNSAPAGFDPEKLLWVNAQHLRAKSPEELLPLLIPFLEREHIPTSNTSLICALIPLFQPRANTLVELAQQMRSLLIDTASLNYDEAAVAKNITDETKQHLKALYEVFAKIFEGTSCTAETLHDALQAYVQDNGLKFKVVGPTLRLALLGAMGGPDLPAVMYALGEQETLARLHKALEL